MKGNPFVLIFYQAWTPSVPLGVAHLETAAFGCPGLTFLAPSLIDPTRGMPHPRPSVFWRDRVGILTFIQSDPTDGPKTPCNLAARPLL